MPAVTYSRPISGIERGYLNAAAAHAHPMIHLVLEGRGVLEASQLEAAVHDACKVNPGLAVVRRGARWVGNGPPPLVVPHAEPLTDVNETALFHRDVDIVAGPIAELHLFGRDNTTLVLRATHAVSDGRGLQHWLRDVFRILRGETPLGAPDTVIDQHFVQKVNQLGRRPVEVAPLEPGPPLSRPLFGALGVGNGVRWTRHTFTHSASAMSARIACAVARHADEEVTVILPVDLRRHDPKIRSTANLSTQLPLRVSPNEPWQRIHGRLLKILARGDETRAVPQRFREANPYASTLEQARAVGSMNCPPCAAIISDHGVMDLVSLRAPGFSPVKLFSLPLLVPYVGTFISSFTSDGSTHLTIAHREGDDPQSISALLNEVAKQLPSAQHDSHAGGIA